MSHSGMSGDAGKVYSQKLSQAKDPVSNIKIKIGNITQSIKQFNFPGGEVGVEIQCWPCWDSVERVDIIAHLKNSDDIMALLMTSDAIDREYKMAKKFLTLNYVPYARQDRVCNEGESLSISVMAKLINSCGFAKVKIADPHSDVTSALINNVEVLESYEILKHKDLSSYYIVAPDAGAYKKAYKWAQKKGALGVITANKVRDVRTGNIVSVSVDADVSGLKLFVVDDICDGGRTFVELAKCLEGASTTELFVTHGIFSKGTKVLTDVYDKVYSTNSYHGTLPDELDDKVNWITL